jgi:copper homeostasis protein
MVGSGVRAHNIAALVKETGAAEYHTTAKAYVESGMQYRNPHVSMGGIPGVPEYGISLTQAAEVAKIKAAAEKAYTEML